MANKEVDTQGYELEVLGQCKTNTRPNSQFTQQVEARHLWSYAQEEALVAVSEQGNGKCWHLITDPERRAKRIAARYADLYFASGEKSQGKLQLYWPALAAFVVKDIVEAYRYAREEVLNGGWGNLARTSQASQLGSEIVTNGSPYEYSLRVYAALAKGNLWLFMDIYPWLWYVLEYGLNKDGSLNADRLTSHVSQRNADDFQDQSKNAVKELPFGANWLGRVKGWMAGDPVYPKAKSYFDATPVVLGGGTDYAYGQHVANAYQANNYVRRQVKTYDGGYRMPPSQYWPKFDEAFYVMDEERKELKRIADDGAATARLQKVAQFKVTGEMQKTYQTLISEYGANDKIIRFERQKEELNIIAMQEQINILQPLIYDDAMLIKTMNLNQSVSRLFFGWLSPTYTLYFSAAPKNKDPNLQITFDAPTAPWDYVTGRKASLPNPTDRMDYVAKIAKKFNDLMANKRGYMEGELRKIGSWIDA
jgi:hypothetical protein